MRISSCDPATMTNAQIAREHERCIQRQGEISNAMVEAGLGHIRPSDERADPSIHPLVPEDLALMDRCRELRVEAELRYGPGLIHTGQIAEVRGAKGYRRVRVNER